MKGGEESWAQGTQLYLTVLQLEKIRDQSSEVLQDFVGKRWITKLHESSVASISQCQLSLKNCISLLHLKHTSEKSLQLNDNLYLHRHCRASITRAQRDRRLFITAIVQSNCLRTPRGSDVHVSIQNPANVARCSPNKSVCRSEREEMNVGFFFSCPHPLLHMQKHSSSPSLFNPPHDSVYVPEPKGRCDERTLSLRPAACHEGV